MTWRWVGLVVLLLSVRAAQGHDIPDERVDRALLVRLEPPHLRASYEVSLSDWTLYQDLKRLAPELGPDERFTSYARIVAPLNARGLLTWVNGQELVWRLDRFEVDYREHPLLTFHFEATVPESGHLRLIDTNYVSSIGTSRIALSVAEGIRAVGFDGPDRLEAVPEVPVWALSDEDEKKTKELDLEYGPGASPGSTTVDSSPIPNERPPDREPQRRSTGPQLTRLLWGGSHQTVPVLVLIAFVIGAAHAAQPGHGKTVIIGASLPGDRAIGQGLLLAGSAALGHFLVAIVLAGVVLLVAPQGFEGIDQALTRGVGLAIGILGAWRIGASFSGGSSATDTPRAPIRSRREAIFSGLAVGAIPCWDAVLLLAIAWVGGEAMLGVGLLLAFSLGASATLLGVALVSGLFRSLAARLTSSSRLERVLGLLGGLLLAGIGLFLFLR